MGARAGGAINPGTSVEVLREVVDVLDQVIVMSVNPGFGGQSFIPRSLDKVRSVRALTAGAGHPIDISVDGGVDLTNAGALAQAGATILVAGASVFGQPDPAAATRALVGEVYQSERPNGPLHKLYDSFKRVLIHDLSVDDFADMYAQTIAYGLFAARCETDNTEEFSRQKAASLIPKTNPLLRDLFYRPVGRCVQLPRAAVKCACFPCLRLG